MVAPSVSLRNSLRDLACTVEEEEEEEHIEEEVVQEWDERYGESQADSIFYLNDH